MPTEHALIARRALCALALVLTAPVLHAADTYPVRPVRFVVPYPPGGTTDIVARIVGAKLGESLGHQVVIDNRPGAGGNIGTDIVAKAVPDGHTLVVSAVSTLAIGASLYTKLPYDVLRDLAPVALIGAVPNVLVVNLTVPAKSVRELIALAKAQPGKLNFASAGTGTTVHFAGELFKMLADVNIAHVPYRGAAPAMVDLIGGQVHIMFDFLSSALPHIKAGRIRALAVTGPKRTTSMPQLPTIAESGVPEYDVLGYFGILAPAKTPPAIVRRLNGEVVRIAGMPDVQQRFAVEGVESSNATPQEFARYLATEVKKWAKVVKVSGVKVD